MSVLDGPYENDFDTFQFPPDRVKLRKAEEDIRRTFGLSFDDEFMRFSPASDRKYRENSKSWDT